MLRNQFIMKTMFLLAITAAALVRYALSCAADEPPAPDDSTDLTESVKVLDITRHPPRLQFEGVKLGETNRN
jgi:hypothetical protein